MLNKFEEIPLPSEANWLIFLMCEPKDLPFFLKSFPIIKEGKVDEQGCSATLIWSGSQGNNVPVKPFHNLSIGYVLNPNHLEIPQGDIYAMNSDSRISPEVNKNVAKQRDDFGTEHPYTTKSPDKKGYYRHAPGGWRLFYTNLARNEQKIYHPQGSGEVFAKNIWRKYHKPNAKDYYIDEKGLMVLNEAIVFQKNNENPIAGLFITETPLDEDASLLIEILQTNTHLKLYLYSPEAKEHIVRVLEHEEALYFLKQSGNFQEIFNQAAPFKTVEEQFDREKTIQDADNIIKAIGLNIIMIPRVKNYIHGNEAHNNSQAIQNIQFEFTSLEELSIFKKHLEMKNIKASYVGYGIMDQPILQYSPLSIAKAAKYAKDDLLAIEEKIIITEVSDTTSPECESLLKKVILKGGEEKTVSSWEYLSKNPLIEVGYSGSQQCAALATKSYQINLKNDQLILMSKTTNPWTEVEDLEQKVEFFTVLEDILLKNSIKNLSDKLYEKTKFSLPGTSKSLYTKCTQAAICVSDEAKSWNIKIGMSKQLSFVNKDYIIVYNGKDVLVTNKKNEKVNIDEEKRALHILYSVTNVENAPKTVAKPHKH